MEESCLVRACVRADKMREFVHAVSCLQSCKNYTCTAKRKDIEFGMHCVIIVYLAVPRNAKWTDLCLCYSKTEGYATKYLESTGHYTGCFTTLGHNCRR